MPRTWLTALRQSNPALAELIHELCVDRVSEVLRCDPRHVTRVLNEKESDDAVTELYWKNISRLHRAHSEPSRDD